AKGGPAIDAVPGGRKPCERLLLDRLDLLAQRRERRAPQAPQHVRVAPFALASAGSKLAADEELLPLELDEHRRDVAPEPLVRSRGREGTAPPCEPQDEPAQRVGTALEEDVRQARRRHRAERVAIAARILGRDQPRLAGDAHDDGAALGEQRRGETLVVLV